MNGSTEIKHGGCQTAKSYCAKQPEKALKGMGGNILN